jgi:hypothetical protein
MTTFAAYGKDLVKLRIKLYITLAVIIVIYSIIAFRLILLGYSFSQLLALVFIIVMYFITENDMDLQMKLILKHGMVDRKWMIDIESRVRKIASALGVKPLKIRIVDDYYTYSYAEVALFGSIFVPLRATRELDEKQLEFLIANAILGFPRNLLFHKYGGFFVIAPGAFIYPFLTICSSFVNVILSASALVLMLPSFLILSRSFASANKKSKSEYARILSVTKDYESAKTALMSEFELSSHRMQFRFTPFSISNHRNMNICEEETAISVLGIEKEIKKLRQAAKELGLELEKGRTDGNQSGL